MADLRWAAAWRRSDDSRGAGTWDAHVKPIVEPGTRQPARPGSSSLNKPLPNWAGSDCRPLPILADSALSVMFGLVRHVRPWAPDPPSSLDALGRHEWRMARNRRWPAEEPTVDHFNIQYSTIVIVLLRPLHCLDISLSHRHTATLLSNACRPLDGAYAVVDVIPSWCLRLVHVNCRSTLLRPMPDSEGSETYRLQLTSIIPATG
jgi:hypothetical protein